MNLNPYQSPETASVEAPLSERQPVPFRKKLTACFFAIIGMAILCRAIVFDRSLFNLSIHRIGINDYLYPLVFFNVTIPTFGIGLILLGIDLWRGTKRLASFAVILMVPFFLLMIAISGIVLVQVIGLFAKLFS